ncbi:hypothetical protein [Nosocomiicoccus sp. HMSC059G07]|nr:hypothetical protein [Nosocomiicoccus sp. HMSC059G07]
MLYMENSLTIWFYGEDILGYTDVVIIEDKNQIENVIKNYN